MTTQLTPVFGIGYGVHMDLTTMTPKGIDAELADLYWEQAKLSQKGRAILIRVHHAVGDRQSVSNHFEYELTDDEALEYLPYVITGEDVKPWERTAAVEAWDAWEDLQEEVRRVQGEIALRNDEFNRRGGWTRAFIVPGGHVHSSMDCSSCYPTTKFGWMPELSGDDEDEIVGKAGERACTVCYPTAPVDVLSRPTSLWTEDEKKAQADREVRAQAKAKKAAEAAAKAPTKSGEPLRVKVKGSLTEVFKTERAALNWLLGQEENRMVWGYTVDLDALEVVYEALSEKREIPVHTLRHEIVTKVSKKAKRNGWTIRAGF